MKDSVRSHIFLANMRKRSCVKLINGFDVVKEKMLEFVPEHFISKSFQIIQKESEMKSQSKLRKSCAEASNP